MDNKIRQYLANEAHQECIDTLNLLLEDMQPKKEARLVNIEIQLLRQAIDKLHQIAAGHYEPSNCTTI